MLLIGESDFFSFCSIHSFLPSLFLLSLGIDQNRLT